MTLSSLSLRALALAGLVGAAALAAPTAVAADYVQARGGLSFVGKYQGETFTGLFPGFSTRLQFDPAAPQAARLEVDIPLAAADTRNSERDSTLKGPISSTLPALPPPVTAHRVSPHWAMTVTAPTARWSCAASASRSR